MISMQTYQDNVPIDLGPELDKYCEQCQKQVAEAEKEMSAFVIAVGRMWGPVVATRAAEYWIELAESVSPPLVDGHPDWRKLTIMASSRLAIEGRLAAYTVGDQEGACKMG